MDATVIPTVEDGETEAQKVAGLRQDPSLVSYLSGCDRDGELRLWYCKRLWCRLWQAASKVAPNDPHLLVFAASCNPFFSEQLASNQYSDVTSALLEDALSCCLR